MSKIKNFQYYYSRGGINYCLLKKLSDKKIISSESFLTSKANARFNRYFEKLPEEDYEKELKVQLDTILGGCGVKVKENPETFNEKIQWLKIHDTTPLKTRLADKYLVREWIAETIGEQYLIPLVGGPWKSADEIDFAALPDQFALKANHGSGMNLIVKDKNQLDIEKAKKTCDSWMHNLFGWSGMEAQYFHIPKRIIAEQYVEQENGDLVDYKIHCFSGEPKIIQIIGSRDFSDHSAKEAFFDMEWNRVDLMYHTYDDYEDAPVRSPFLDEMIEVAKKLSEGFIYVRVDLYEVRGHIYFGEMTFTPANGTGKWGGAKWSGGERANREVGAMINLPNDGRQR